APAKAAVQQAAPKKAPSMALDDPDAPPKKKPAAAEKKAPPPAKKPAKSEEPEDNLDVLDESPEAADEPADADGPDTRTKTTKDKKAPPPKKAAKDEDDGEEIDVRKHGLDAPLLQLREWVIKPNTGQMFSLGYKVLDAKSRD